MSNLPIFPNLVGLSWEGRQRTPEFKTLMQTSVSGLETAIQLWEYPRYSWQLSYDVLRSDQINLEWQALLGFFLQVGGPAGTWLFEDWEDNTVFGQPVGTGDGSTASFQLYRTVGGFTDPVLAVNQVLSLSVSGQSNIPTGAIADSSVNYITSSAPSWGTNPAVSSTLLLDATTNPCVLNVYDNHTDAYNAAALWIQANQYNPQLDHVQTIPFSTRGIWNGWYYVSVEYRVVANGWYHYLCFPYASDPSWYTQVIPADSGMSFTTSDGVITFSTAPANGAAITADFSYFWKCRFSEDTFDAEAFAYQFWALKKIAFKSVKLGSG